MNYINNKNTKYMESFSLLYSYMSLKALICGLSSLISNLDPTKQFETWVTPVYKTVYSILKHSNIYKGYQIFGKKRYLRFHILCLAILIRTMIGSAELS